MTGQCATFKCVNGKVEKTPYTLEQMDPCSKADEVAAKEGAEKVSVALSDLEKQTVLGTLEDVLRIK